MLIWFNGLDLRFTGGNGLLGENLFPSALMSSFNLDFLRVISTGTSNDVLHFGIVEKKEGQVIVVTDDWLCMALPVSSRGNQEADGPVVRMNALWMETGHSLSPKGKFTLKSQLKCDDCGILLCQLGIWKAI